MSNPGVASCCVGMRARPSGDVRGKGEVDSCIIPANSCQRTHFLRGSWQKRPANTYPHPASAPRWGQW